MDFYVIEEICRMLTIFTIPKPFIGHIGRIQRNAIKSWKLLDPSIEVILFGNEEGATDVVEELGLRHIPDVLCNEWGTPYISNIFSYVQKIAKYDVICFANCDIILLSDFLHAIHRVEEKKQHFFIAGTRRNIDYGNDIDVSIHSENKIRKYVEKNGNMSSGTGMDYLVFTRGIIEEMPKFLIGRPGWDNWMMWYAADSVYPFIQCTSQIMAIHQNHDYSHVPKRVGNSWEGPEAQYNRSLIDSHFQFCFVRDANYILTEKFLLPSISGYYRGLFRSFRRTISLFGKYKV